MSKRKKKTAWLPGDYFRLQIDCCGNCRFAQHSPSSPRMMCHRHHAFYEGDSLGELITVDQDGYCPRHERWNGQGLRGDCLYLEAIRAGRTEQREGSDG